MNDIPSSPDNSQSRDGRPGAAQPHADRPDIDRPGADDPDTRDPGVDRPGADDPGAGDPDAYYPDDDYPGAEQVEEVRRIVEQSSRILVLTGAGISTESGIPDFRGPNGVWTKDPDAEKYSTIEYYMNDENLRIRGWSRRVDNPTWGAEPNTGHQAVVALERSGKVHLLVTQNVDGLHLEAGSDPERVVEIHGSVRGAMCTSCVWRGEISDVLDRVRAGEADPRCEVCGGILKSTTIFFGEQLVEADLQRSYDAAGECDLILAVGTSLSVYPVAALVPHAVNTGAKLVILNAEETPFDLQADAVLRGSIGEILPQLLP